MRYLRDTYNSSSEEPLLFSTAFTKQKLLPIKHFLLLQLLRTLRSVVKHVFKKCIYAFNDEAYDLANSFDMTKILEYQNYVELTKLFHLAKERYNLLLKYFFLKKSIRLTNLNENHSYFPSPPKSPWDLGLLEDVEVMLAEDPYGFPPPPARPLSPPAAPPEEVAACMIGLLGHFDHHFLRLLT